MYDRLINKRFHYISQPSHRQLSQFLSRVIRKRQSRILLTHKLNTYITQIICYRIQSNLQDEMAKCIAVLGGDGSWDVF